MPTGRDAEAERGRTERFRKRLGATASPDGFVPFDRFMDLALYGEGVGYYARPGSPFGRAGDYYTAAQASPLFGRAVGARVRSALQALPRSTQLRVLELGPGDGALGAEVVTVLEDDPGLRSRVQYGLVDRTAALSATAYDRVVRATRPGGVRVVAMSGVGADGPFSGVVLANEVLDAQPVRRLRWDGARWRELGVRLGPEGTWSDAEGPEAPVVPLPELPVAVERGTTLEVSPMAEGLIREVADHLTEGLAVFVDYGLEETELLAAHPSGTLSAVRRHRVVGDPLADPGGTDLSVFVNVRRVRYAARRAGLTELAFRPQAEALGAWGFPRLLDEAVQNAPSAEDGVRLRLGAKSLLFGFERFFALELVPPRSVDTIPDRIT